MHRRNPFSFAVWLSSVVVSLHCMAANYSVTSDQADAVASSQDVRGQENYQPRVGRTPSDGGASLSIVYPFEIPALDGAVTAASLELFLTQLADSPNFAVDLYGLPYRESPAVLQSDFYSGAFGGDATPEVVAIADNLLTPSSPTSSSVNLTDSVALKDYINAQLQNGAVAGDYLFLRLSPDFTPPPTGAIGYYVAAAEYANSSQRPQLTLTTDGVSPQINVFATDDLYVQPDESFNVSWEASNADSLTLTDGDTIWNLTSIGQTGSKSISLSASSTLTLEASNNSGVTSHSLSITVGPARPNIILFLVDDMGWQDTSVSFLHDGQGNEIITDLNERYRTPNMENLAAQGVRFTNAYANPVCSPSRTTLMTGLNSARHRVTDFTKVRLTESYSTSNYTLQPPDWRNEGADDTFQFLPAHLQDSGYRTILAGKAHFGPIGAFAEHPENLGFEVNIAGSSVGRPGSYYGTDDFGAGTNRPVDGLDAYHGKNIFLTEAITLEMMDAIEDSVEDGVPFFAYMTHYAVHAPFQLDQRFAANYPELSGEEKAYATLIEGMDKSLGDLMNKVAELGVAEDTLVIFLSDNGGDAPIPNNNSAPIISGNAPLRGKKAMRYEGGIRVPMICAWAQINPSNSFQEKLPIPTNVFVDDIIAGQDIMPTLLSISQSPPVSGLDGFNISGYLRGESNVQRPQEILLHYPHDHNNYYFSILRDGPWKLIYNYVDDSYELYNLEDDIGETQNLANAQPEKTMAMARKLAQRLHDYDAQWPQFRSDSSIDRLAVPNFEQVDTDGDELPDVMEDANRNGLQDMGETSPESADTDFDGSSDYLELATGTDPLNMSERFQLNIESIDNRGFRLSWPSIADSIFHIENYNPDMAHWTTLFGPLPGTGALQSHDIEVSTSDNQAILLRLQVEMPAVGVQ